jgi:predicted aspartyl protease
MGRTRVTTRVTQVTGNGPEFVAEFLADTGALECLADGEELRKIGINNVGRDTYELSDGTAIQFEHGFARIDVLGDVTVTKILLGVPGVEPIFGAITLQNLGILVDPRDNRLRRTDIKPMK